MVGGVTGMNRTVGRLASPPLVYQAGMSAEPVSGLFYQAQYLQ